MYFQTWMYWCKTRKIPLVGERIYRAGQRLCGRITGHPLDPRTPDPEDDEIPEADESEESDGDECPAS